MWSSVLTIQRKTKGRRWNFTRYKIKRGHLQWWTKTNPEHMNNAQEQQQKSLVPWNDTTKLPNSRGWCGGEGEGGRMGGSCSSSSAMNNQIFLLMGHLVSMCCTVFVFYSVLKLILTIGRYVTLGVCVFVSVSLSLSRPLSFSLSPHALYTTILPPLNGTHGNNAIDKYIIVAVIKSFISAPHHTY